MAAPNIVNVTTITGKLSLANVTTETSNVVANATDSGKVLKVNSLIVSNLVSDNVAITTEVFRNANTFPLISNVVIATNSSFTPFDKTLSLYLEEGDYLRIFANANSVASAICSYEEIS